MRSYLNVILFCPWCKLEAVLSEKIYVSYKLVSPVNDLPYQVYNSPANLFGNQYMLSIMMQLDNPDENGNENDDILKNLFKLNLTLKPA